MLLGETVRAIDQRLVAHLRGGRHEIVHDVGRQHDVVPRVAWHHPVGQFVEFAARPFAASLPQIAAFGSRGGDGARPELELRGDGRHRLVNLGAARSQGVVPELHAILGLQGIKPQHRHLEGKIVPRLGDGDDQPVELHEALFDEALTVRRLRVDEERRAGERRFARQDRQHIGRGFDRPRLDFGQRQAEAARQHLGDRAPAAVFGADDHRERPRALEPPRQPLDARDMPFRNRATLHWRYDPGDALIGHLFAHEIASDALVEDERRRGGDRAL